MKDSSPYSHLTSEASVIADCDDETRIAYVDRDNFVPHGVAEEILTELERLYRMEDAVRPQGRLLVGRSLMGKTTLLDEFMKNHCASDNPEGDSAVVPVVYVQYPDLAREGIFSEILSSLNARLPTNAKSQDVRAHAISLMKRVGARMILIDEFHNVLEGSASAQRRAMNSIKYLMNELRRPIVVAGTIEVLNAIRTDEQIHSRLTPMPIRRFQDDSEFQELLALFEMGLPLRKPSNLYDPGLSSYIYSHTNGVVGHVVDLLNKAARLAITEGMEMITRDLIEEMKWERSRTQKEMMAIL